MSDRNENEEGSYKKSEEKKSGLRSKDETSGEKRNNNVSEESVKVEESSGKNPKLKKDLKELFDNFGQDADSQANKSPLCSVETSETVKKDITSESYSEQCIENLVSTDEFSGVNNKESYETTLDGKIIVDDSCHCHETKCTCSQTDHNITDIDESQICYTRNEVPPYNVFTVLPAKHAYVVKDSYDHEDPPVNRTNRYNYNQVQIRHRQKEKTRCSGLFPRRTKITKSQVSKNDSGETIPQLYKANVKHLRNHGYVPEKFTFRAVTGNLPGRLEYYHPYVDPGHHPYVHPGHHPFVDPGHHTYIDPGHHTYVDPGHRHYINPGHHRNVDPGHNPYVDPGHTHFVYPSHHSSLQTRHRVNFVDDNVTKPDQRKLKKERKCIFKQLRRKKNKGPEKNKLKYPTDKLEHGPNVHVIKKNHEIHPKNDFFDQEDGPNVHLIKKGYEIHPQNDFFKQEHGPNMHLIKKGYEIHPKNDFFDQDGSKVYRTKKNYEMFDGKNDGFFDQACLTYDGNEYISNKQLPDRIDIYCFDHLNTSYFRTCDQPPPLITDIAMEKTEEVATRFWAEIFGFIHVIIAFFIAFILQLYKFLLYSIVRPIMVGLVQLTSDYFFKPLLTITYNGFTQPFLVFLFNVAASIRDLCLPIAKGLGYFISEIAGLLRAIRLVDCGRNSSYQMRDSCC
ncbi:uncharacterized protein [Halyomorpha halys]|uniref:uncharacterized protein isoform X2 n=1 Tax=Halyomorpha halys TaxID=286706 RepID=UPI0006D4CC2E|nr:uncharacterized protein LOC106685938 isoform X2 [Halyomorpha halys]